MFLASLLCVLCLYCNVLSREVLLSQGKEVAKKKHFEGIRFLFITCVFVICSLYFDCRQLDNISPEVVDALNDVWDTQVSMLDWDQVTIEDAKSPFFFLIFVMCAYAVCQHLACVVELNLLQ